MVLRANIHPISHLRSYYISINIIFFFFLFKAWDSVSSLNCTFILLPHHDIVIYCWSYQWYVIISFLSDLETVIKSSVFKFIHPFHLHPPRWLQSYRVVYCCISKLSAHCGLTAQLIQLFCNQHWWEHWKTV